MGKALAVVALIGMYLAVSVGAAFWIGWLQAERKELIVELDEALGELAKKVTQTVEYKGGEVYRCPDGELIVVVDDVTVEGQRWAVYHPIDDPQDKSALPFADIKQSVIRDGKICSRFERLRWDEVVPA